MSRANALIQRYNESTFALDEASIDLAAIKKLGNELQPYTDDKLPTFIQWIEHFPKSGRAPNGEKKLFDGIKFLQKQLEVYREHGLMSSNIASALSWWSAEGEMDRIADVFFAGKSKAKVEVIKHGNVTFHNGSSMSEARFKKTTKTIADLLKGLKGFHKKALSKPLEIHFKYTKEIRAKAVYKGLLDQVWVKESSKPIDLYGHLLYVIIHELGHRYEFLHKRPKDFEDRDFYTTKYSRTETMAGSESFAEIFALSHWPDKYNDDYSDQIERFNAMMK